MDTNIVIVKGRLTRDVEYRLNPNGTELSTFSIAINGIKPEDTVFLNCSAFGKLAQVIKEYLNKGKLAIFSGRLKMNKWVTPTGENRSIISMIVNSLDFLPNTDNQNVGTAESKESTNNNEKQNTIQTQTKTVPQNTQKYKEGVPYNTANNRQKPNYQNQNQGYSDNRTQTKQKPPANSPYSEDIYNPNADNDFDDDVPY